VLVILVARNGAPWLRQCLVALSRQSHPRIGVLAIDDGSTDQSGGLLETALGEDRVIALAEDHGYPAAIGRAMRSEFVADADYLLFLHDDTVLAPEAIAQMVEAAERIDGAGVVGPKVLDWDEPRLLLEIGMTTDRLGYPYSPLEEGEIDQGQYDRVREVLFVSSCAMLVSKAAWTRIGAPDDRLDSGHDDLDLCWRARLAGFRVLMTPAAEARHREASERGEREGETRQVLGTRYGRERSALAAVLKNYGILSLAWVLPLYAIQGVARVLVLSASRRFGDVLQVLAAWGWNVAHLPGTVRRRFQAQSVRSVPDREVRRYMAPASDRLRRWAGAARQALIPLSSPGTAEGEDEEEPQPSGPIHRQVVRLAVAHPVATAWVVAAVLGLVAYRDLFGASPLAGGQLLAIPSSPSGFFRELLSGLRHPGLGGSQAASPALGLLGAGSVLSFGNAALFEKVLLFALPAVAGAACYRTVRSATGSVGPAVVAGGAYALSPVVLWTVSQGRLPALVFLAGLPWLAPKVRDAFDPGRRTSLRWAVGAGLGLAVLESFYPGTLLAAGLLAAVAAATAPRGGARTRGSLLVLAAAGAAAMLALPVTAGLFGSGGRTMGDLVGSPSFASLARLSIGPAPGASVTGFYLPAAAALGAAFVARSALRSAGFALMAGVGAIYLAWLGAAGYLPAALSNPVSFAGVGAFCFSLLIGLGLSSVVSDVSRQAFGRRQLASAAMALILGLGLLSQAALAAKGGWAIGGSGRLPLALPLVGQAPGPAYRVLWLGPWSGEGLSAPAGPAQGRVAAGPASVSFAVTAPSGGSLLDVGRPAAGPGYDYLRQALDDVLAGQTHHGGALLSPLGIRFVVASPEGIPDAAVRRLAQQLDLDRITAGGLVVFRNPVAAPLASVVRGGGWDTASRAGGIRSIESLPSPGEPRPLGGPDEELAGSAGSKGLVLLSQQFQGSWRLHPAGGRAAVRPRRAFGWAVGFPASEANGTFVVRFGGQRARDALIVLLAALWLAALWITRRPSAGG